MPCDSHAQRRCRGGELRERVRSWATAGIDAARGLWAFLPLLRTSRHSERAEWARRLEEEKQALAHFVQATETEFLATGRGLNELARSVQQTSEVCDTLARLATGEVQDAAVQFAFQLLKKAEDLVLASYDQYDHVFVTFDALNASLAGLRKQHEALLRVLAPLTFITVAFRVEASRQPVEVREIFYSLAADIVQAVNEVRRSLERQFEELGASEQIARRLIENVSTSVRQHRRMVAATLETSRGHLRQMNDALAKSGLGATDLSTRNRAIMGHVGSIVMAQQCQDITRQKIEHIQHAMDEIRTHLPELRTGDSFVADAAVIQSRQLQSVFDELDAAAAGVVAGIDGLRREAAAAAATAAQVGGTALTSDIGRACQQSFGDILTVIRDAVAQIAHVLAAFRPLQDRFVNCTTKATELARKIRYDALNAQIFAIHAPSGATLEVLADRMRSVTDETVDHIAAFGGALRTSADMVNNLCQRLADFQQLGLSEQQILCAEAEVSQAKLAELEAKVPSLIECISVGQVLLGESADRILEHIHFPNDVAVARARALTFFEGLIRDASPKGAPATRTAAAMAKLAHLKASYTMAAERDLHATALEGAEAQTVPGLHVTAKLPKGDGARPCSPQGADKPGPACPDADLSRGKSSGADSLGDNVELF